MNSNASFWNRIAPKYAADPIKDMAAYDYTLARTRSYLGPADRVLELGCGTASTALQIAPWVGHLTATDFSDSMIAIARQKLRKAGLNNLSIELADLDSALLPAGPFDAVLAFNLLHLLHDPDTAIGRVRGLVKPGGLFISKTACMQGAYRLMALPVRAMRLVGKAPNVSFFSTSWLESAVQRHGFEILESGDYPLAPPRRYIVARRTEDR